MVIKNVKQKANRGYKQISNSAVNKYKEIKKSIDNKFIMNKRRPLKLGNNRKISGCINLETITTTTTTTGIITQAVSGPFLLVPKTIRELNRRQPDAGNIKLLRSKMRQMISIFTNGDEVFAKNFEHKIIRSILYRLNEERPVDMPWSTFVRTQYAVARYKDEVLRATAEVEFYLLRVSHSEMRYLVEQLKEHGRVLDRPYPRWPEGTNPFGKEIDVRTAYSNYNQMPFGTAPSLEDLISMEYDEDPIVSDPTLLEPDYDEWGDPLPKKKIHIPLWSARRLGRAKDYDLKWVHRETDGNPAFNAEWATVERLLPDSLLRGAEYQKLYDFPFIVKEDEFIELLKSQMGTNGDGESRIYRPKQLESFFQTRYLSKRVTGNSAAELYDFYPYYITWWTECCDVLQQPFLSFETVGFLSFPSWVDIIVVVMFVLRFIYGYYCASQSPDEYVRYTFYKGQDSIAIWLSYGFTLSASELGVLEDLWIRYRQYLLFNKKRTLAETEKSYQNFVVVWKMFQQMFPWKTHREITVLGVRYWARYMLFVERTRYKNSGVVWHRWVIKEFRRQIREDFTTEELTPPKGWQSLWFRSLIKEDDKKN